MGRYSRKDMIEFAKFAKSWSTPRNVERAYEHYLKGMRLTGNKRGVKPLTEGKTKTNVKQYPNGIPQKKGGPPPPPIGKIYYKEFKYK